LGDKSKDLTRSGLRLANIFADLAQAECADLMDAIRATSGHVAAEDITGGPGGPRPSLRYR
jgi:hypothetical protein